MFTMHASELVDDSDKMQVKDEQLTLHFESPSIRRSIPGDSFETLLHSSLSVLFYNTVIHETCSTLGDLIKLNLQ